jgi:tRNA(Arg) A34 adenosine deaminase TadA
MEPRDEELLRVAITLALRARANGNHPFGCVVAAPDGTILAEAENTVVTSRDCTGHAETNAMRSVSAALDPAVLAAATLYASTEPCAMCTAAIYWGGVRRIVYALPGEELRALGEPGSPELRLSCREVAEACGHPVEVVGPALDSEALAVHQGFWTP